MSDQAKTYACPECGFHYRDEDTMKKCEAWCKEHGSCNSEITKLSVERTPDVIQASAGAQTGGAQGPDPSGTCDDGVCRRPQTPADLEKKVEEATNQYLRALADYQNLQKEVARERLEMGQYAVLRVVERFLPALDYLKTAEGHVPTEALAKVGRDTDEGKKLGNWIDGISHIARMFEEALRDLSLRPIKTVGEKFDATKHEAVGEEDVKGSDPERGLTPAPGTILKEVQAGYEINGKVVRPARVIVCR